MALAASVLASRVTLSARGSLRDGVALAVRVFLLPAGPVVITTNTEQQRQRWQLRTAHPHWCNQLINAFPRRGRTLRQAGRERQGRESARWG